MEPTAESYKRSLTNHTPSPAALARIEALREAGKGLVDLLFEAVPHSRERSLALTHLEETVMWAVKAVVLTDPDAVPAS